jgi:hypothetical protein
MGNNTNKKKALWVTCKKTSSTGEWRGVELFPGNSHTEVKGRVTKIQFQRGRLTRDQMHHPPFHQIALWK